MGDKNLTAMGRTLGQEVSHTPSQLILFGKPDLPGGFPFAPVGTHLPLVGAAKAGLDDITMPAYTSASLAWSSTTKVSPSPPLLPHIWAMSKTNKRIRKKRRKRMGERISLRMR